VKRDQKEEKKKKSNVGNCTRTVCVKDTNNGGASHNGEKKKEGNRGIIDVSPTNGIKQQTDQGNTGQRGGVERIE